MRSGVVYLRSLLSVYEAGRVRCYLRFLGYGGMVFVLRVIRSYRG